MTDVPAVERRDPASLRLHGLCLDVPRLVLSGDFACRDALKAMEGHILDRAVLTGTYTLNPNLAA